MWSNDRTAVLGDLMSAPESDGSKAELDYGGTVTRETVTGPVSPLIPGSG